MKPVMMAKPAEEEGCIDITIAEIDSCLKDLVGEISTNLQLPFQGKDLRTPEYHLNALDADWSQIEERSYETLWYQNTGHSSATEENKAITGATFVAELEHDEHITEFRPRCDALYSPKSEDNAEDSFPMLSSRSNTLERDNSPRNSESCQYNVEITPSTNISTQTNMVERDSSLELMGSNSNVTIWPSMAVTKLQETREQKLRPRCDAYGPKLEDNAEDSFPMLSSRSNTLERDNSPRNSESSQYNVEIAPSTNIATQTNMIERDNGPELTESNSNVTILPSMTKLQETREQKLRPRCDAYSPKSEDNAEDSFPMLSSRSNTLERDNSPRNSESCQYNVEITPSTNIATQTNMVERDSSLELMGSNSNVTILPSMVATKLQETREQKLRPRCDAYGPKLEDNAEDSFPMLSSRSNTLERDNSTVRYSESNQNKVATKQETREQELPRCDAFSPTRLRFNQDNVVKEDSFQIHSTRLNVVGRDNSPVCSESNHDNVEIPPLSNIATQTKVVGKESSPRVFEDNEKNDKIRSPQIAGQRNVTERVDSSQWSQSNQNNMESSSLTVLTKPQSGKREKPRPRSELIRTCTSSPNHTDLKYADCREKRKTELWGRNSKVLIFNTSRDRERYRRKSK